MTEQILIGCPFCKKLTVKVLHQSFVARKSMTKSRFGIGGSVYTKEKNDVLSGCEACGKSLREIEKEFNEGNKGKTHEERLQASGLPTKIVRKRDRIN